MDEHANLPAIVPEVAAVARIQSEIDITDRSRLVTFGERAQHSVVNSPTGTLPKRKTVNSETPANCCRMCSGRRGVSTRRA